MRNKKESKESQKNAGLAGAGGGTLIAVIANQLPDSHFAKPLLHYSAPSFSILLTALWVWIQVQVVNLARDRAFNSYIRKARQDTEKRIQDPHITEEYRSILQSRLRELDEMKYNRLKSRIMAFAVVTDQDIKKTSIENRQAEDVNKAEAQ